MKTRRFQAAFLLIVCALALLTVSNAMETTVMSDRLNNVGCAFAALGHYCDIGKNYYEVLSWSFVSGYWAAVAGFAIGGGVGLLVGVGVGL